MEKIKSYSIVVLLVVIILLLSTKDCKRNDVVGEHIITPADTVYTNVEIKVPTPYKVVINDTIFDTITSTLIQHFDTTTYLSSLVEDSTMLDSIMNMLGKSRILKVYDDYISQKIYNDTIKSNDVELVVVDTIQLNSMIGRGIFIKNLRESKIIYTSTKPYGFIGGVFYEQNRLWHDVGAKVGININNLSFTYGRGFINGTNTFTMLKRFELKQNKLKLVK